MEMIHKEIEKYAAQHSTTENSILQKINRETHLNVLMPRMLSGHLQGNVLAMFSQMIRPKRVLEIGTYTGYSAICLAAGLQEGGKLITLDINEELEETVRCYFEEARLASQIDYRIGNALEIIPTLNEEFDLVFIDADKINYLNYYHLVFDKVRKGGFIIADNVLWDGKVLEPKTDKDTEAIKSFNRFVQEDSRVFNALFTIRDGLLVAQKI